MFPFLFFVCVFDLFFFVYFGREKGNKTLCREKKERAHFHFRFLQKKRKKNSVSSLKTSPRRWSSKEALLPAFFAVEAAAVECSLGCRTLHSQTPPSLAPTASAEAQRRLPPSPLDCCSLHAWDQATTVGVAAAILAAASAVEVSGGGDGAGAEAPPSPPPPPPPPAAVSASGRGRFAEEESAPLLLLLLSCCRCHSSSLAPGSSAEDAEARDLEAAAAAAEAEAFGTRLADDEAKGGELRRSQASSSPRRPSSSLPRPAGRQRRQKRDGRAFSPCSRLLRRFRPLPPPQRQRQRRRGPRPPPRRRRL